MSSLFSRLFPKRASIELELGKSIDDNSYVDVFVNTGIERVKVKSPQSLLYGSYSLKGKRYIITQESLDALLSVLSRDPTVNQDGRLSFPLDPHEIKYLRRTPNTVENESSKAVKIHDKPLSPIATIDYEPGKGASVEYGYEGPEKGFVKHSELKKIGSYIKISDEFYPLGKVNKEVEKWLEEGSQTIPLSRIPEFFLRDLVLLKTNFKAVLNDEALKVEVFKGDFTPIVKVKSDEPGWLSFQVEYHIGDTDYPHSMFEGGDNYIQVDDHKFIRVDKQAIGQVQKRIDDLDAIKMDDGYKVEAHRFITLEEFIEKIGGVKQVSAAYDEFLNTLTNFNYNPEYELPPDVEADLRRGGYNLYPFQRAGIHWLDWMNSNHLHGILADDMGLGKTLQTIAAMRLEYERSGSNEHSLVICPLSVVVHWQNEIRKAFPRMQLYEYHGQNRNSLLFYVKRPIIFVTSYDTMANDIAKLSKVPFLFVILDEGTKIKNPLTKRTQAVKQLNAVHRFSLSGTPIENRPAELWSVFDFLMKGHLGSYDGFVSRFENPINLGSSKETDILANRIKPFILRRKKEDVAKDLPEKIQIIDWCELTNEQAALYRKIQGSEAESLRKTIRSGARMDYTSIFAVITKLKQVCDHPALITGKIDPILGRSQKFDLVVDKMEDIISTEENMVIFSHFLKTLDLFEAQLRSMSIKYLRIDGSTRNRQEIVDRFNTGKVSVVLGSLQACCHGINLTGGNHVIHVDRWWNPAIEDQATDRVHRIGQKKTVIVHKILTRNTLEEKIDRLIEKKRGISERVIGAATEGERRWTREELLEILSPLDH